MRLIAARKQARFYSTAAAACPMRDLAGPRQLSGLTLRRSGSGDGRAPVARSRGRSYWIVHTGARGSDVDLHRSAMSPHGPQKIRNLAGPPMIPRDFA